MWLIFWKFRSYERSELQVHVFFMVLKIFNNESVNLVFKYKLGVFNTWELVPDYKLEFLTQKFKNLDEIQHTEIFAVGKFWSGKIVEF